MLFNRICIYYRNKVRIYVFTEKEPEGMSKINRYICIFGRENLKDKRNVCRKSLLIKY